MVKILLNVLTWVNRLLYLFALILFWVCVTSYKCESPSGIPYNETTNYNFDYYLFAFFCNLGIYIFASLERKNMWVRHILLVFASVLLIGGFLYRFYIPC